MLSYLTRRGLLALSCFSPIEGYYDIKRILHLENACPIKARDFEVTSREDS